MHYDVSILQCPSCKTKLDSANSTHLTCQKKIHTFKVLDNIPYFLEKSSLSVRDANTHQKFEQNHTQITKENCKEFLEKIEYGEKYSDVELLKSLPNTTDKNFLEIGCAGGISGYLMEQKGYQTFGIDFAKNGLEISQEINDILQTKTRLVQGDIRNTPYKDETFDIIYGGGTLEHVEETQTTINELYRITKSGGLCINSVPVISISSLTYRQLSGNIPEIPIIKNIFTFAHEKILKTKYMHTGYEKSFLPQTLIKMHQEAGFKRITIQHHHIKPELNGFPKIVIPYLQNLENYRPFWLGVAVIAEK